MIIAATGTMEMDANNKYIRTLFQGELLRQFDLFSTDVEDKETLNV